MQLSKHFSLEEMTRSMVAARKGIDNTPGAGEIKNLENVCYEILEPVRAHFDKPLMISSGYRSEALCEAIGSKKTSQHAKGQAVDFEINRSALSVLRRFFAADGFTQRLAAIARGYHEWFINVCSNRF